MELKPGYKLTEVGVIPEEWEVKLLHTLAEIRSGLAKNSNVTRVDPIQVYYLRVANVQDGFLDLSDMSQLEISRRDLQRYSLLPGDVLMNEGGDRDKLGRGAIWRGEFHPCIHQNHVFAVRCSPSTDPDYLTLWSAGTVARQFFLVAGKQTTNLASINKTALGQLPVAIPLKKEQSAIAEALSDVDALMSGLDTLIAKKRGLKQAAMQQLLTGKTRLQGFEGEWEVKRLGDILTIRHGKDQKFVATSDGTYPILATGGQIGWSSQWLYDKPSVLIGRKGTINRPQYMELPFWTVDTLFYSELHGKNVAKFFYYRFCLVDWMQFNEASGVPSLNAATLESIEVLSPLPDEQTAIAQVLSDMDVELATLEARREKTRLLKQGMMQELLTGRTRLVRPIASDVKLIAPEARIARHANVHFRRSVLAAEIVDRLYDGPTFGHVKFEKTMFLVERLCKVETGSEYHRDAAGPYDNRALRSIDSQLKAQKWFEAKKIGDRYRYIPLSKRGGHKSYFERYYSAIRPQFNTIINTVRRLDTEQCEIVATLYSAWDDLSHSGKAVSDQAIIDQVLNHWHESKQRIPEDRWLRALGWMKEKGFMPVKPD